MSQSIEEVIKETDKLLADLAAGSQYPQALIDCEVDADFAVSK